MNIPRIIEILEKYRTNADAAIYIIDLLEDEGMDAMRCELYFHRGREMLLYGEAPRSDQKDLDAFDIICNDYSRSYLNSEQTSVVCDNILRALKYKNEEIGEN